MARTPESEKVGNDQYSVNASTKNCYRPWEDKYSCDTLEEYYYGMQWSGDDVYSFEKRKYCINLFYASINISKPSMLFQMPKYKVTADPERMDDAMSDVEARAKLQESVLNTYVRKPKLGVEKEVGLAILDAQFRFGLVEVGYTADYMDNPNADAPILENGEPLRDRDGNQVMNAKYAIKKESLYYKWIPAKQARFSERSTNRLETNDWVAYFEWQYISDIKKNPRYKNTTKLNSTGRPKGHKEETGNKEDLHPGMVKVWKKWDMRAKEKRVWAEGHDKYFLVEKYEFLPFADLKFDEILGQYLPLPPSYNWAHPQNQLNDIREMRRLHRSRAVRRFLRDPRLPEEEFAKIVAGEDMACAVCPTPENALIAVQDAPLDPAVFRDEATTLDDFTRVSGISGESQQVAQSETATQANLIALMGQTRENAKRKEVGMFLSKLGRITLMTLREKMVLPLWIKATVDPYSPLAPQEAVEVAKLWKQIDAQDIGDVDDEISVDLASMSPVQQAQERQDWITFLTLLNTPGVGTMLSTSPALLRKTASLFNINSERDLVEVSNAVQAAAMQQAAAMAAKAGVSLPGTPAPGSTPTNSDTVGQLQSQLPVEQAQGMVQ